MKTFVEFCIRRPVSVGMLTVAVIIFGAVAFSRLALSLLPDISYPTLTVETRYAGAAPAEMESLVTRPVEEAVGVVSGVERLSSRSRAGVSQVTLQFLWKTNMDIAALDVREKLDLVVLPRDAEKPVLLRFDPASDPILRVGLSGSSDLAALRQLGEEEIKRDLDSIDGVAAVKIEGGLEREIQVDLDERRLAVYGITVEQVSDALARNNINLAGGSIYEEEARYLVRTLNEFQNIDDVAATAVVDGTGRRVLLRDVADVRWGHKERESIARVGGKESVELKIFKEGDSNTVDVARRVKGRLAEIQKGLPEGTALATLFDQSIFIEGSIAEVVSNAWQGGLLAILVIALFLRDARATTIIGLSIPVSVVATFFIMYQMGLSLNIMSLGGLALGIGLVVDDSIVVLESIYRHRALGKSGLQAAAEGTGEVAGAVVASTLTTVAVFLPIVFVEGVAGQLFKDQALTVSMSILASLCFSLTLIPVVAARLAHGETLHDSEVAPTFPDASGPHPQRVGLRAPAGRLQRAPSWVVGRIRALARLVGLAFSFVTSPFIRVFARFEDAVYRGYPRLVEHALSHRAVVLSGSAAILFVSLLGARTLGIELIPNLAQGEYFFDVELKEGTPLESTDRVLDEIGTRAGATPGVAQYFTSTGTTSSGGDDASSRAENRGRLQVMMKDKEDRIAEDEAIRKIRAELERMPGVAAKFGRPSYFSFESPIELEIYGNHEDELARVAGLLADRMRAIPGLTDVKSSAEAGNPELQVSFSRDRIAQMGLSIDGVSRVLRTKLRGDVATRLNEGERQIDVVVRASEVSRTRTEQVDELNVEGSAGRAVQLKTLARTELATGPSQIRRVGQRRAVVISANVAGRDLGSVSQDLERAVERAGLPPSVTTRLAGQHQEMQSSFGSLYLAMGLAIFLVYFVMASQFESLMHPFIILFTIPLGAVGVIWGLVATGQTVSVIVLIGVVMLAGIVVKNAIIMVDYINRLRERGVSKREAIVTAGQTRLRPILMTTLTAILGLVPMALGLGEGAEIRAPMAITVIGGLTISTLLTLVVIPVVYSVMDRKQFGEALAPEALAKGAR